MSEPTPSSKPSASSTPPNPPPKRKWLRRTIIAVVVVLVVLFILVALAPTLLSTGVGKSLIESVVNKRLAGRVEMDSLGLAWGNGQSVTGLKLVDPSGKVVVTADRIEMPDTSIWSLARGGTDLGTIRVVNLVAAVEQLSNGKTNLQETLSSPPGTPSTPKPPSTTPKSKTSASMRGKFEVVNANASYTGGDGAKSEIKDLNVTVDALDLSNIHVTAASRVLQAGQGGKIDAKFDLKNGVDPSGALTLDTAAVDGSADVSDIPTAAVDDLLGQKGTISAVVGPTLAGRLTVAGNLNQLDATLTVKALHLAADVGLQIRSGMLTATPTTRITLNVLPETWAAATHGNASSGKLLQPFDVVLAVDQLSVPITAGASGGKAVDWTRAAVKGGVQIGDVVIDSPATGRAAIRQAKLTVATANLAQSLDASLHAVTERQDAKAGSVDLSVTTRNAVTPDGAVDIQRATFDVTGSIADLPLAMIDEVAGTKGLLADALGPVLNASLQANVAPAKTGAGRSGSFNLSAQAANLDVRLHGTGTPESIQLDKDSTVSLTVQQPLVARFPDSTGKPLVVLTKPVPVTVAIQELVVPVVNGTPASDASSLNVVATVPAVEMQDPQLGAVALRNVTLTVNAPKNGPVLTTQLKATAEQGGQSGGIDATVVLTPEPTSSIMLKSYSKQKQVSVDANITNLPVATVDVLSGQAGKLVALLGPKLDSLKLTWKSSESGPQPVSVAIASPHLNGKASGTFAAGKELTLDKSSQFTLDLTPEAWTAWFHPTMALSEPARINLNINDLHVIWLPPPMVKPPASQPAASIDGNNSKADVTLTIAKASFVKPDQSMRINLADAKLAVQSDAFSKLITIKANSTFTTATTPSAAAPATGAGAGPASPPSSGATSAPGKLASSTELRGLAFVDGKANLDHAVWQTDTQATDVPVVALDDIMQKNGELVEILGATTNLTIKGGYTPDKPSDIDLTLHGGNAVVDVSGTLDKNKVLTLRKDATAAMRVTPGLSKILLAKLNPLLSEAQSGKDPIKLLINQKGFSAKVSPYDPLTLNGDMKLDIGTLIIRRSGGVTDQVLDFFVQMGTNIQPRQEFPAIFTTLIVQIRNGTISTNDLWFTTDQHDLTMGSKAVITPKGTDWYANTVLGIGADTFANSHLIGAAINPDSVFEITVKGKLNSLNIDPGKLALQMGPMLLKSVKGADALGGLIDQAGKALGGGKSKSGSQFVTDGWPNKPKAPASTASQTTNNTNQQQQQSNQTTNNPQQSPSVTDQIQGLFSKPKKKKNNN